jgi:hypothetical protein
MFAIDQVLDGVVKAFNRTFTNVTDFLPLPGMDSLQQFVRRVSRFATTYIDEAILTRAYAQDEQNVWAVAKDGGILYAQAWKPILANAVALTLLSYVEFLVFLVILGVPAVAVGALIPSLKLALGIAVLLGAWMLKLAVAMPIRWPRPCWRTTGRRRGWSRIRSGRPDWSRRTTSSRS